MHKGDEPFDHRPISNDRNIGDRVNSREEKDARGEAHLPVAQGTGRH